MSNQLGEISLDNMDRAVERVRERLWRATAALEQSAVPYAVIGGHAIAASISRVDQTLVRYTRDVDLLVRRADFARVKAALESAGFVSRHSAGVEMFLEGAAGKARDAVHVLFAGEKVRDDDLYPAPDIEPFDRSERFRFVALESIVRMKLTSFRLKDQVHLQDLIQAGLIDDSLIARLPADLAARLKPLIDNPNR
jgi:hypothetical protein